MSFTKFASFECSSILDVKGSKGRAKTASLSKLADFEDYRTEDGYLYARIRAISSRVNKNHDGWPSIELAGGPEVFEQYRTASNGGGFTIEANRNAKYGFSTFLAKPIFVDHHNSDPSRARGVIMDAKLHVEDHRTAAEHDPYYASAPDNHMPPTWIELLLEVDAKSFPRFAQAILDGSKDSSTGIDGFSMGCDVEKSVCNICKNSAVSPDEFCSHIRMKGAMHNYRDEHTGERKTAKSYEDCYGVKFFEISGVFDPADETALTREVRAAVVKEAAPMPCGGCSGSGQALPGHACPQCQGSGVEAGGVALAPRGGDGVFSPGRIGPDDISGANDLATNDVLEQAAGQGRLGPIRQGAFPQEHVDQVADHITRPPSVDPNEVMALAQQIHAEHMIPLEQAMEYADLHLQKQQQKHEVNRHGEGDKYEYKVFNTTPLPFADNRLDEPPGNDPNLSAVKQADNPAPQSEMIKAPEDIDTLREEKLCPICATAMDNGACDICGYIEPPEGFNNPDLSEAAQSDNIPQVSDQQGNSERQVGNAELNPELLRNVMQPQKNMPLSAVTSDMKWTVVSRPHLAGRINPVERPVNPGGTPSTNEPSETVLSDEHAPVTAKVRTAAHMLAAVGRDKENTMERVADSVDATAAPDVRTDATGVGGVSDASNEQASKADAQVDVAAKGGTGVEDVSADSTDHVDHGTETTKNIEGTPTDTWSGTGGNGVTKQESPVGGDVFPSSDEGVKRSHDSGPYPADDGGLSGGGAVQGVKPIAEQFGDRVDVLDTLTSPSNNSGPTTTWSGTDGNGVLKQQDPVTTEVATPFTSKVVNAFKLAELEISLGLLAESAKYARITELGERSDYHVATELAYAERVRTAGLKKSGPASVVKQAKKLPVLGHPSARTTSVQADESDPMGGTLFGL